MATVDECEKALHQLADRMAASQSARDGSGLDRSLTCRLRDLDVMFAGELVGGHLRDIHQLDDAQARASNAKIRLDLTSDDLLEMVDGRLNVASAWASGRMKIGASKLDLLRLRSIF